MIVHAYVCESVYHAIVHVWVRQTCPCLSQTDMSMSESDRQTWLSVENHLCEHMYIFLLEELNSMVVLEMYILYVFAYIYIYIYIYIHAYIPKQLISIVVLATYLYICACMYICTYTYIHTYTHIHTYIHVYTYMFKISARLCSQQLHGIDTNHYAHIHVCVCTYIYIYTYTYTYSYI